MPNDLSHAAPLSSPLTPSSPAAGSEASAAPTTAAQWLLSNAEILEAFRAEDLAFSNLHAAHVEAYYVAESCEHCGDAFRVDQLVRVGRFHLQCPQCYEAHRDRYVERDEPFGVVYAARCRGPL